jgi:hypothetical protein
MESRFRGVAGAWREATVFPTRMRDAGAAAPKPALATDDRDSAFGQMVYEDFQKSEAQYPGSIFGISLAQDDKIEFFSHRPYDRYSNITHEDLSPMCFRATVRGRLEKDDHGRPVLTLKDPQSVREYFEFKNVPERERSPDKHVQMVHDEYIQVARKLIVTGLPAEIYVELTGLDKFFPDQVEFSKTEPFPLEVLARQALTTEKSAAEA